MRERYGLSESSRARRAGLIGTSELGAIAGIHPFVSPWQVWNRIVLGEEPVQAERMELGSRLERTVARIWAEREGVTVRHNRQTLTRGHLASTADAYVPARRALLEVKVTNASGIWAPGLPEYVRYQAIGQAYVYRRPRVYVVALIGGTALRHWLVEPTRAERRAMRDLAEAFWTAHIATKEIPLPMFPHELAPYLRLLQGLEPEKRRPATEAELLAASGYLEARRLATSWKRSADLRRIELLEAIRLDPRELIVGDGWTYTQDPETGRIVVNDQRERKPDGETDS